MNSQPNEENKIGIKVGGVGMPAALLLDEFGWQVFCAFGSYPYHVGSSLLSKRDWRDVDVRLILSDEEYEAMGLGSPDQPFGNGKWVAFVLAFSALGKQITGLPIDFQIQQQSHANSLFSRTNGHVRSTLGITYDWRHRHQTTKELI